MSGGLRTTVVGSWWPLVEFEAELLRYHHGELPKEDGEKLLNHAATLAIEEQRRLGLTEWTGGEHFAYEFIDHLQQMITGLKIVVPSKTEIFDYDDLAVAEVDG